MVLSSTAASESTPLVEVTLAILYREDQFLMQLRDDFPHIIYPGVWGFFGGHIEPGEAAETGVRRELMEELAYVPPVLNLLYTRADSRVRRYFYYGELVVPACTLVLGEGQDLALCSEAEIRTGKKYSAKLNEIRPLGGPHQQVLLDFIDSGLMHGASVSGASVSSAKKKQDPEK